MKLSRPEIKCKKQTCIYLNIIMLYEIALAAKQLQGKALLQDERIS